MSLLSQHIQAKKAALRRLATKPMSTLLSALVVAIALTLPALGYVLADNASRLAQGISGRPEISVFMDVNAAESDARDLERKLHSDPGIAAIRFIPKAQALKELASEAGLGNVTATLGENPLPDALIITPRDDSPAEFLRLKEGVSRFPGVAHVQLDTEWVQRLDALLRLARSAVGALAALLGTALVIVTFNTIRLQILTQRHEIGVSLLLGATRPWVRRPFLWFGLLQGALGGVIAWGLLQLILIALRGPATRLADSYGIPLEIAGPGLLQVLGLVALAAALGWLGAALSVRRHLKDGVATD